MPYGHYFCLSFHLGMVLNYETNAKRCAGETRPLKFSRPTNKSPIEVELNYFSMIFKMINLF